MGRPGGLKGLKKIFEKVKELPKKIKNGLNSPTGKKILNVINKVGKGAKKIGELLETVIPGQYKLIGTGIKTAGDIADKFIDDETNSLQLTRDNFTDAISKVKVLNPNRKTKSKNGK